MYAADIYVKKEESNKSKVNKLNQKHLIIKLVWNLFFWKFVKWWQKSSSKCSCQTLFKPLILLNQVILCSSHEKKTESEWVQWEMCNLTWKPSYRRLRYKGIKLKIIHIHWCRIKIDPRSRQYIRQNKSTFWCCLWHQQLFRCEKLFILLINIVYVCLFIIIVANSFYQQAKYNSQYLGT